MGETEEDEVKEGVGQGNLESAIISSLSLVKGVEEYFSSSQWESSYGRVRLQPATFQDDISRMVSSLQAARAGNSFFSSLMEGKLLSFNTEKSVILVTGDCKKANEMRKEIDKSNTSFWENNEECKTILPRSCEKNIKYF